MPDSYNGGEGDGRNHHEEGSEEEIKRALEEKLRRERKMGPRDPFVRAENEDDDGYDPYSDRRPAKEPLFQHDPWA